MSTTMITPQQILDDRNARRAAGLAGCMTGKSVPEIDFFGYRDVQIWNMDANGLMPGQEGFNRKNPYCLCFDHRDAFDPKGEVDAELVNERHMNALYTYRNLVPDIPLPEQPVQTQNTENDMLSSLTSTPSFSSPPGGDTPQAGDEGVTSEPPGLSNNPSPSTS